MAKKASPVHTTPSRNGTGWTNVQKGAIISTHPTQKAAAEAGRAQAVQGHTEHRIHGRNGQIRQANSYGHDPNPPRDRS